MTTITRALIEQLEAFDVKGAPALSVYLNVDPKRQVEHSYRIVFEDLVKETREQITDKTSRATLETEAARVQTWMENVSPQGKGLVIFSCEPRDLWQTHFLPVAVADHVAFEPRLDVAGLFEVIDEYERFAVALIDKQRARLFTVYLGQVEESEAFRDFVPGRHDQGALAQARYQRHHDAHVHWHLKHVVNRLADMQRRREFDRLILAGPEEATSELRRLLPHALAHRLAAIVRAGTSASDADVLEMALDVERRIERQAEERLVRELVEQAGAGGRATLGVPPTLEALGKAEVLTLVVAGDVRLPGSECPNCGWLDAGSPGACGICGTPMHAVHDLAHRAMGRTLEQAGSVEVVHDEAAKRLQAAGGGLGALLRFRA